MSLYEITISDPNYDLKGYIVIDSLVNGISAGGLRMSPDISLGEIKKLAAIMTKKYAALNIELGGAKAGIEYDPSKHEKKILLKRFAELTEPLLKHNYFLGEDLGVTGKDVAYIYESIHYNPVDVVVRRLRERGISVDIPNKFQLSDLFGKSYSVEALGLSILEAVRTICRKIQLNLCESTVAIQGFGTVGQITAEKLLQSGAKIIAIEDSVGCVVNNDGLPIPELLSITDSNGVINRTKLPDHIIQYPKGYWIKVNADILIPAAIKDSIHEENCHEVNAKVIIEAANMPVTSKAEKYLIDKGVYILPDYITNAGAAAFFGLLISGQATMDTVFIELHHRIRNSLNEIVEIAFSSYGSNLRY
ncbi:Glu/Leu/Phe/Val dehydrogenase, partial [Parageobacillus toebii]